MPSLEMEIIFLSATHKNYILHKMARIDPRQRGMCGEMQYGSTACREIDAEVWNRRRVSPICVRWPNDFVCPQPGCARRPCIGISSGPIGLPSSMNAPNVTTNSDSGNPLLPP